MEIENPRPKEEEELPNPKRQKMSTTTTSDDETKHDDTLAKQPRYKRRKIAIFFAYCGVGYQGMQKNPGAKTIEGDLEEALFQSGAIPEPDRGKPNRFDFSRSARTDKGVSAVGQVVSGRFFIDPPGFVERLNSNLSPQILIFGYKRVTGAFHAKKFCDRRRYVYLLPVFALDPSRHRDRETVLASLGGRDELVMCLECSERGRKVFGMEGKSKPDSKSENEGLAVEVGSGISSNTLCAGDSGKVLENEVSCDVEMEGPKVEGEKTDENSNLQNKTEYCYGEKEKERFNRILKCYQGTHNFHNFTTRTKAEDPSAIRFIVSFTANTTLTVDGIEFIKCEVVGQSFMLHQIRKMIGLAVAIMRNIAPESLIEKAFTKEIRITVPMAPEVGLYLDECFFSSYNQKWKHSHEEVSMKDYAKEAEDFKLKHIYPHIALTEDKVGVVALWLHSLNYRNYPDIRAEDKIPSSDVIVENGLSADVVKVVDVVENGSSADVAEVKVVENGLNDDVAKVEVVEGNGSSDDVAKVEVVKGNGSIADVAKVEVEETVSSADAVKVEVVEGNGSSADVAKVEVVENGPSADAAKVEEVVNMAA